MTTTNTATADPLTEPLPPRTGAHRLDAIDMLRGLVIALMVLDHVRDFVTYDALRFDPTDPLKTYPLLFATRWVTHLCATSFVFLAGVSIDFQRARGKTGWPLSRFLLTRGLWLIALEATVISFGFNFAWPFVFFQVIWAIGASMIAMALLARLPCRVVFGIGVAILLLYPFVVTATSGATGAAAAIRTFALAPGLFPGGIPGLVMYAAIPWLGVMCLGFGLGPMFRLPQATRQKRVALLGLALIAGFVVLRGIDGYGDPAPWAHLATVTQTTMSFLNVSKYPPSPDYVLATLGVALLIFAALERLRGPLATVLLAYGRTPLFTYLAHLYIAHGIALLIGLAMGYPAWIFGDVILGDHLLKAGWGFPLAIGYLVWAIVLAILFPLSRWMAGLKQRRRDWWLSYI